MWTRRGFIAGALMLPLAGKAHAQHRDLIDAAYELSKRDQPVLGAKPLPREDPMWDLAADSLDGAPTRGRPYDVARYMSSLPGDMISEWPRAYANPLIMLQFAATNTRPTGDVTPWCAAFVSWCIERVGFQSQHSASSQAYLNWSIDVWREGANPEQAKEGDVAVFTSRSDTRHGHVAFFVNWEPWESLRVLGGNQRDTIGEQVYGADKDLRLATIRWA